LPTEFQGSELYRSQEQILAAFLTAWQAAVPDVWVGEDGTLMIMLQIESSQIEGLYFANQLVLQDMFIQTASSTGLQRHGNEIGLDQLAGTPATGELLFSGEGGVYVPTGTEAGYDPGGGADILYYQTTVDGTIPNPGIPTAPTVADGGAGNLSGTFEWAISFLTTAGETLPGAVSNAITLSAREAALTNIPLGGPGTTERRIYRSANGGPFLLVTTLLNNTATTFTDNVITPGPTVPVTVSTAQSILLAAASDDNGSEYNVGAGSITILSDAPPGLTDVTNPNVFDGGSDIEDIEHYRQRLLEWYRSPQTGAPSDLETWAETVAGVDSATAFTNQNAAGVTTPGTVTVRISGPNGSVPDSTVVDNVEALLASYDLANVTVIVTTFTATVENVSVTLTVDPAFTVSQLTPNVKTAIQDYINNIPAGGTLYVTGIIAAVRSVNGVNDVVVSSPSGNIAIASTNKFVPGTITVS
jgi:uncharacterized phage protein gp47/JayE